MNLQHQLLIAMPALQDPIFGRSVIYICEHNENGAMGLIINKATDNLTIARLLDRLQITPEQERNPNIRLDSAVLIGGPLAEDRGFILHSAEQSFSSSLQVSSDTIITTSKDVLETLGTDKQPKKVMVVLGCASWSNGQLESEIMENSWLTVDADSQLLFHTPLAERWQRAAGKLGVDIHNIPLDAGHA